jgi:hypothetical protein
MAISAALLALGAGTALGQAGVPVGERPDCVAVRGEVVNIAFGFRHSVHVTNGCAYAVDCRVSSDVNPDPHAVHLAPGAATDVVTHMAAPGSGFTPRVECPTPPGARVPRITDPGE